jgi:hypothetical protein
MRSRKRGSSISRALRRGNLLEVLEPALAVAHAGVAGALVAEQVLGVGPALVLLAHAVGHRHFHVVEPDLVHLVLTVEHDDRPHGHARGLHVDQQEGDALLRAALAGGAHQAEDPVGVLRQRGPGLLAVDHIDLAAAFGAGFQRGQVGAGARLGIALAPPVLARADARQEVRLLRRGAEGHDHRRYHAQAEGHQRRRAGVGAFFLEDVLLGGRPARAAKLHRPGRSHPALAVQGAVPVQVVVLVQALAAQHLGAERGGQMGVDEAADLGAEALVLGGVIEIHASDSV